MPWLWHIKASYHGRSSTECVALMQIKEALREYDELMVKKEAYKSEALALREGRRKVMAQMKALIKDRDMLLERLEQMTGERPKVSSVALVVGAACLMSLMAIGDDSDESMRIQAEIPSLCDRSLRPL